MERDGAGLHGFAVTNAFKQGLDAGLVGVAEAFEAELGQGAVFAFEDHHIGDGADARKIAVGFVIFVERESGALGEGGGDLDPFGLVFALLAAVGWASYILLSRATGRYSTGVGSLGLAMAVAALLVAPAGVGAGAAMVEPATLAQGASVALLAGLIPFSLELVALRPLAAGITLHVSLVRGRNVHHIIEATFKGLGRCLRDAVRVEGFSLPSTKGVL